MFTTIYFPFGFNSLKGFIIMVYYKLTIISYGLIV